MLKSVLKARQHSILLPERIVGYTEAIAKPSFLGTARSGRGHGTKITRPVDIGPTIIVGLLLRLAVDNLLVTELFEKVILRALVQLQASLIIRRIKANFFVNVVKSFRINTLTKIGGGTKSSKPKLAGLSISHSTECAFHSPGLHDFAPPFSANRFSRCRR